MLLTLLKINPNYETLFVCDKHVVTFGTRKISLDSATIIMIFYGNITFINYRNRNEVYKITVSGNKK